MADLAQPVKTSSLVFLVWWARTCRASRLCAYWAGTHAGIVLKLPKLSEYVQHLFSATDHGWPSSETVGTRSRELAVDRFPEIRFKSTAAALTDPLAHARGVLR